MESAQLFETLRVARVAGMAVVKARLSRPVRGIRNVVLRNLDGCKNGDQARIWVESESGAKLLGFIWLGSDRVPACTGGWESKIDFLNVSQDVRSLVNLRLSPARMK